MEKARRQDRSEREGRGLGPWNPGLSSRLPTAARPLATVFRLDNVYGGLDQALERSAFTGLEPEDLAAFRPERLVVHELLIRVTGDISVPDGNRYADLGINFRKIVDAILKQDVMPAMADIASRYAALKAELKTDIAKELDALRTPAPAPEPKSQSRGGRRLLRWLGLSGEADAPGRPPPSAEERQARLLARWREDGRAHSDPRRRRLCRALSNVIGAVAIKHGRVPGDVSTLADIALDCALNDHGSAVIGEMIEPLIKRAAEREGHRLLPVQAEPLVMNVKGASAAGKSTLRPLQRKLAERIGVDWADFALISPDIWRKYLLDYDSLGEWRRYAGTLTGHELKIVDQKLDRYMAEKARRGAMSHLLIDRFRFDSFAETEGGEQGARLLTRFGSTVYMFFVITPPDATVERAWKRGLEFGRFKAVDDLLHHNVEAFSGMPDLFFTWALRRDKKVHYEFLDNSVPAGRPPKTIAFGWNDDMTLLDVKGFLDVDRYKRIDIEASGPDEVYPDADAMAPANNTEFLKRCARQIRRIAIADQASGRVILRFEDGRPVWIDREAFERAAADPDFQAGMAALVPIEVIEAAAAAEAAAFIEPAETHTLGAYGLSTTG
jgi:hypothetical protein